MRRGKLRAFRARRVKPRRGEGLPSRIRPYRLCGVLVGAGTKPTPEKLIIMASSRRSIDYSVAVRRQGWPPIWTWEIRQGSLPLAVRASVDSFTSEMAAQRAGEKALSRFLAEVAEEEQNLI